MEEHENDGFQCNKGQENGKTTDDRSSSIVRDDHGSESSAGESDYDEQGAGPNANTWMGVRIKPGFGFLQWMALPVASCGTIIVAVYVTTQLTYMLQAPEMFDIPEETIGRIAS